ncbi:tripartite tricarboxylate transporter TctB family protein [Pelagibacterium lacus]|uniref:tripartite tricarboxylate transporter TctB family protein n=1 Tax=Pelagibacterium lacus TaxID=2282655 RepID=UPI001FEBD5D1|nr:tripartite tricarboxylate transporter TctB family protein [Pelagibacterium lacus]
MSTESAKTDLPLEEGSGQTAAPRPFWIGGGLIAIGAIWMHGGLSLPQGARYAAVGPGLTPTLIGAVLVLLGVILIVQILRGERFEPQDSEDAAATSPMDKRAFFTALVAVFLPVGALPTLGLPLTAALAFTLVTRALGSTRLIANFVIGGVIGSVSWLLFTQLGLQLGRFFPPLGF